MLVLGSHRNVSLDPSVTLNPRTCAAVPTVAVTVTLTGTDAAGNAVNRSTTTDATGAWRLDLDRLLAAVTPATRVLLVNAPNNPTGWTLSRAEQAEILRWSFWVVTECEKDALAFLMHGVLMPPGRRKPELAALAQRRLLTPLRVLEQHLQSRPYLAGGRFTVADVCVASVAGWAKPARELMAQFPLTSQWLEACLARPANQKLRLLGRSGQ